MIATTSSKIQYNGNGATLVFAFPYVYLDPTHIVVYLTDTTTNVDTLQVLTTNYSVAGGNVTFVLAPPTGQRITIKRVVPFTQIAQYVNNDNFPAVTHEATLDRLTMIVQVLSEQLSRCLVFPDGELAATSGVIPNKTARTSKILAFDGTGNLIVQ